MRGFRVLISASVLVAAIAVAGAGASPVAAAVPVERQPVFWQHVCEKVAEGTVSPQPALVCVHSGVPMWRDHVLEVVQRLCERPLGGIYEYRSQAPSEFAACFFN